MCVIGGVTEIPEFVTTIQAGADWPLYERVRLGLTDPELLVNVSGGNDAVLSIATVY